MYKRTRFGAQRCELRASKFTADSQMHVGLRRFAGCIVCSYGFTGDLPALACERHAVFPFSIQVGLRLHSEDIEMGTETPSNAHLEQICF